MRKSTNPDSRAFPKRLSVKGPVNIPGNTVIMSRRRRLRVLIDLSKSLGETNVQTFPRQIHGLYDTLQRWDHHLSQPLVDNEDVISSRRIDIDQDSQTLPLVCDDLAAGQILYGVCVFGSLG